MQCVGISPASNIPVANPYTWSCFSDVAWDSLSENCGMGWHLRDPTNSFIESSSSHRRFVSLVLVAEALTVKAALVAAVSSHVSSINMYYDSKILISLLTSHGQDVVLKSVLHESPCWHNLSPLSLLFISRI